MMSYCEQKFGCFLLIILELVKLLQFNIIELYSWKNKALSVIYTEVHLHHLDLSPRVWDSKYQTFIFELNYD